MLKRILIVLFMLILNFYGSGFAQTTAAEVERSQEILQQGQALRQKISGEEKFFVKTIIVKGALSLSEEEIKESITPFQGHWMTKEDIRQLIDLLKSTYVRKGINATQLKISHKFKKDKALEITVNEPVK